MLDDLPDFIKYRIRDRKTIMKERQESMDSVWGLTFMIVAIFLITIICTIN